MRIRILDEFYEINNDVESIEALHKNIRHKMDQSKLVLSHLIVDEYEVYENYQQYLLENFQFIKEIQVVLITIREYKIQIFNSAVEYLERALPEVELLANEFYNSPTKSTWNKFELLIEGIEWIFQMRQVSAEDSQLNGVNLQEFGMIINNLHEKLADLSLAVTNNDLILIGDYLLYEITPNMSLLNQFLQGIVKEYEV